MSCRCTVPIADLVEKYGRGREGRNRMKRALLAVLVRVAWQKRRLPARRPRRLPFDAHAIREAAKLLEEQAVSLNFALQRPGCEERLAKWMRQPRRLRNRQTSLMHIEEMERRLRRMLKR